jgi:hypothetical protein
MITCVNLCKSNTVGYAINGQVIGMGAGQQSRVDWYGDFDFRKFIVELARNWPETR